MSTLDEYQWQHILNATKYHISLVIIKIADGYKGITFILRIACKMVLVLTTEVFISIVANHNDDDDDDDDKYALQIDTNFKHKGLWHSKKFDDNAIYVAHVLFYQSRFRRECCKLFAI